MDKLQFKSEKLYQSTMHIVKEMLSDSLISEKEYREVEDAFIEKYAPTVGSLFTELPLTSNPKRVMYRGERK